MYGTTWYVLIVRIEIHWKTLPCNKYHINYILCTPGETWIIIIISDFSSLNYLFGVRFVITKSCSEYYVRWLHRIIVWCNIDFMHKNFYFILFFCWSNFFFLKFTKEFWQQQQQKNENKNKTERRWFFYIVFVLLCRFPFIKKNLLEIVVYCLIW